MAKMYYTQEETLAKLACDEDQLRDMVREGKVREFRDAGKLNYRVDEVDRLIAERSGDPLTAGDSGVLSLEDSTEIPLAPMDEGGGSGAGLSLGDTDGIRIEGDAGGSTAELTLEDSGAGPGTAAGGSGSDLADSGGGSGFELSDSGGGSALGLGDSGGAPLSLEDSGGGSGVGDIRLDDTDALEQPESTDSGDSGGDIISLDQVDKDAVEGMKKDDTVITNIGISVFDDDDLEIAADPMAKTLMTGSDEHLGLDGSGGGSGLLDLTRESDDTSLGAELLEGIDMGDTAETEAADIGVSDTPSDAEEAGDVLPEPEAEPVAVPLTAVPVGMVGTVEAASPAFSGLLVGALIALVLTSAAVMAMTMQTLPGYLEALAGQFWAFLGGCLAFGGLFCLVGWLMGRQSTRPKRQPKPKAKKPKKAKKGKKGKKGAADDSADETA